MEIVLRHPSTHRTLWLILGTLSFIVALVSMVNFNWYRSVIAAILLPGTLSQDIMTVVVSLLMVLLTIRCPDSPRVQMLQVGNAAYLFYAYGIYVIEQVYTPLYLAFIVIVALSFYSLLFAVRTFELADDQIALENPSKGLSTFFLIFIPVVFNILWIAQLAPVIKEGEKLEYLFSVYILDLCFIMPAFLIAFYLTRKGSAMGLFFGGSLLVLGATLLLPVGLGELFRPAFSQSMDVFGMIFFTVLSLVFLVIAVLHLKNMGLQSD